MGENSKIEWCHHTFNPWWGCVKVSPACDHCYAESFAKRTGNLVWGKDAPRRFFGDKHWAEPLKWNLDAQREGVRRRVFCASMADVMEDREELHPVRKRLYELIRQTPQLDWLLLTKRPQNFRKFLPEAWLYHPQPNVWGMTTVESGEYLWRIDSLLCNQFAVYGLSMEPLLSPVTLPADFLELGKRAWVIAGGESGSHPRPTAPSSFLSLRDQCVKAAVPFHFKQWGEYGDGMVRLGKTIAGRRLDGRTWDELPQAS